MYYVLTLNILEIINIFTTEMWVKPFRMDQFKLLQIWDGYQSDRVEQWTWCEIESYWKLLMKYVYNLLPESGNGCQASSVSVSRTEKKWILKRCWRVSGSLVGIRNYCAYSSYPTLHSYAGSIITRRYWKRKRSS